MAKCATCGRKGLFLRVNKEGACGRCVLKEQELEQQLLDYITELESEERSRVWGVPPWPYETLANMYGKKRDHRKEVAILERFAAQKFVPSPLADQLLKRLENAK